MAMGRAGVHLKFLENCLGQWLAMGAWVVEQQTNRIFIAWLPGLAGMW
jgi:hypothetical protein